MNLDASTASDPTAALLAAVDAATAAVAEAGAAVPAAAETTDWELDVALAGSRNRWLRAAAGHRSELAELARALGEADASATG